MVLKSTSAGEYRADRIRKRVQGPIRIGSPLSISMLGDIAFSPDSRLLAMGGGTVNLSGIQSVLKLIDLETETRAAVRRFPKHYGVVDRISTLKVAISHLLPISINRRHQRLASLGSQATASGEKDETFYR